MKCKPEIAAYILAGGFSSRMGREKGLLEFGGVPLITRTVQLVEALASDVTVIGPPGRYAALGLRAIPDQPIAAFEDGQHLQTPLIGIHTALDATTAHRNLILACDLPYLTYGWLDWLLARAVRSEAQIVVPRTSRGIEPLAAVYNKECASGFSSALQRGVRKVTEAMAQFQIEFLPESEWARHDPDKRVLKNMNTPADYEEAKRWIDGK